MKCKICGKKLSVYNKTGKCYCHTYPKNYNSCFQHIKLDISHMIEDMKLNTQYPKCKKVIKKTKVYRKFTPEEDKLILDSLNGYGMLAEISKTLGRTRNSCWKRRERLLKEKEGV